MVVERTAGEISLRKHVGKESRVWGHNHEDNRGGRQEKALQKSKT